MAVSVNIDEWTAARCVHFVLHATFPFREQVIRSDWLHH
jgi:hypothetical protein